MDHKMMDKGWTSFPGWTTGGEGPGNWKTLNARPDANNVNAAWIKTVIARDPTLNLLEFKPENYRPRIQQLSALLDAYQNRDIHWMKIDVEGMEGNVLQSWAPSLVRPWIVVLESTLPLSQELSHGAWDATIVALGKSLRRRSDRQKPRTRAWPDIA